MNPRSLSPFPNPQPLTLERSLTLTSDDQLGVQTLRLIVNPPDGEAAWYGVTCA